MPIHLCLSYTGKPLGSQWIQHYWWITSPSLLTALFAMQTRMVLPFLAEKTHHWLLFNFMTSSTPFSSKLLSGQLAPSILLMHGVFPPQVKYFSYLFCSTLWDCSWLLLPTCPLPQQLSGVLTTPLSFASRKICWDYVLPHYPDHSTVLASALSPGVHQ